MVEKHNNKPRREKQPLLIEGHEYSVEYIAPDTVEIQSVPAPTSALCYLDQVQLDCKTGQVKAIVRRSNIATLWVEAHIPEPAALVQLRWTIERCGGAFWDCTTQVIDHDADWYSERLLGIAVPGNSRAKTILTAWDKQYPEVTWFEFLDN